MAVVSFFWFAQSFARKCQLEINLNLKLTEPVRTFSSASYQLAKVGF